MQWHTLSCAQTLTKLSVSEKHGLSDEQAKCRISRFGENRLQSERKKSIIARFFAQLNDFMIMILLAAAAISLIVSLVSNDPDFTDPIIILSIVLINAAVGTAQESRAQHAIDRLKALSAPHSLVLRNEKKQRLLPEMLVPGDIIYLSAGDIVPADCRLLKSVGLKAEESALTGESEPTLKDADFIAADKCDVAERKNMLFSSTSIVAGNGVAVVCETGMNTQIGAVAGLLSRQENEDTPLQKRLASTGKALGIAAIVICGVIFLLGVLRGNHILDSFMLSVSLAVAAIPEGLPAIVTAALALGVRKMVKENAIVRRLPAVETLGSATVICSDKTGTLTQNKMTVEKIFGDETQTLTLATLCSNATAQRENGVMTATGDPTETAIVVKALSKGIVKAALDRNNPRVFELPFDPVRKMMTTVHKTNDGYTVITKGAPDIVLGLCRAGDDETARISAENARLSEQALRVIAVAFKKLDHLPERSQTESDLTFSGLIGMIDPPRDGVKESVATCRLAGIRPIMITGDHGNTACAIAKKIGILPAGSDAAALTGAQIDALSDRELKSKVREYSVFSRVTPLHKVRVVKALKANGEIVAMTGDGINDAPALKAADIGCAMGKSGTDVARSASDIILTDDNFSTIVAAVRHGRGIYDNIKKSVRFLLSCNIGEILTVFLASLFALPSPLLAIQLLWVNLITDSLPAIALGFEPFESDLMHRRPKSPKSGMFSKSDGIGLLIEGCLIGALTLLAFTIGRTVFDVSGEPIVGRTMAFCVLSISQLVHAFNIRSEQSVFAIGLFSNPKLCGSFVICLALQIAAVSIPYMRTVFKTSRLLPVCWLIVGLLSVTPLLCCEITKRIREH